MIRHPITLDELRSRIEAEAPGWLADAAERTERFRRARQYDEESSRWGRIKRVYMRVQHEKCAYCERRLAAEDFGGAIEHDLEHYRPKSSVPRWPSERIAREREISYEFETGEPFPEGYYLLAYHVLNYAVACKKCNSPLKANYFPVAGPRGPQSDDPAFLQSERPFLLYPLGNLDEDPEEVLTFLGVSPVPREATGPRGWRARVTIDLLELDRREELWRERAEKIVELFVALKLLESEKPEDRSFADRFIETLLSPQSAHTSCARAFQDLYKKDRKRASEIARAAQTYLSSQS